MKINLSKGFLILIFIICSSLIFASNNYSIVGYVRNINTNESIGGARVFVLGTNIGTYSSMTGLFKLPFLEGKVKIKISSIGYKSKIVEVDDKTDTIFVLLKPVSIKLREALVIGDIEADEVIRRAISNKIENKKAVKTLKSLLYSKLVMELDGAVFSGSNDRSFTLAGTIGDTAPEKYKMFLIETFSRVYNDFEKNVSFSEIIQRRQTSNIKPSNNLLTIGNILDFSKDEIYIINTNFVSPIGYDAFDYYDFEIIRKDVFDEKYIYVIRVRPKTDVYPLFDGIIKIVEGDYQLIEVDLKPSETTKIAFVDDLHFIQKFDKGIEGLWAPRMFEVTGKANVEFIRNLLDVKLDLKATSIYSDVSINVELPDSIYSDKKRKISVSQQADSLDNDYWEKNSLREITEKEKQMYAKVDSLVAKDSSESDGTNEGNFRYSLFIPYIDFNRVSSLSLGLSPKFSIKNFRINFTGAYSLALKKILGSASFYYSYEDFNLTANLGYDVDEMGTESLYPRLANTLFAGLFHYDYYDYFYKESYGIDLNYGNSWLAIKAGYYESRDYSLDKSTDRSLFLTKDWRDNNRIDDGHYRLINSTLIFNIDRAFNFEDNYNLEFKANFLFGQNIDDDKDFAKYKASLKFAFPTFFTGYSPMKFEGKITYAKLKDVPLQYSERLNRSLMIIKLFSTFGTLPLSMYERDEMLILNVRYNFTDLWWRWLGLPTYYGRGLDLILVGATGNFKSIYKKQWYSEFGFALERIPTFVSNVIYLGIGFDWGIGNVASGNFGGYINLTAPF